MNDKVRGGIAIAVGLFALYQGEQLWQMHPGIKQSYFEFALGAVAVGLGVWRYWYKPTANKPVK